VHRAGKDQATKNKQVLTHGRNQNLAIGVEQPPLIILAPTRGTCDKRPQLGRAGPFRAPVRDADADNNPSDRKCLVLAQAM
jgi:hypothetical protein